MKSKEIVLTQEKNRMCRDLGKTHMRGRRHFIFDTQEYTAVCVDRGAGVDIHSKTRSRQSEKTHVY